MVDVPKWEEGVEMDTAVYIVVVGGIFMFGLGYLAAYVVYAEWAAKAERAFRRKSAYQRQGYYQLLEDFGTLSDQMRAIHQQRMTALAKAQRVNAERNAAKKLGNVTALERAA